MSENTTRWGIKEVIIIQVILLGIRILVAALTGFIFPVGSEASSFAQTIFLASGRLLIIPVILYYAIIVHQTEPACIGLRLKGTLRTSRFALKSGFSLSVFILCAVNIPNAVGWFQIEELNPLIGVDSFSVLAESLPYFFVLFLTFFSPLLAEELYYRGFLFDFLRRKTGMILGGLLSALFFALMQPGLSWPAAVGNFKIGLLCVILTELSESVLPSTIFRTLLKSSLILYVQGW